MSTLYNENIKYQWKLRFRVNYNKDNFEIFYLLYNCVSANGKGRLV